MLRPYLALFQLFTTYNSMPGMENLPVTKTGSPCALARALRVGIGDYVGHAKLIRISLDPNYLGCMHAQPPGVRGHVVRCRGD